MRIRDILLKKLCRQACWAIWALGFFTGCSMFHLIHPIEPENKVAAGETRIIAYKVIHDAPDHLALWIKYFYKGDQGDDVFIGVITKENGASTGYWAYRADPILVGKHWARVLVSINEEDTPPEYTSDELQFEMYKPSESPFIEASVPYKKTWRRLAKPLLCHKDWGRGCCPGCP